MCVLGGGGMHSLLLHLQCLHDVVFLQVSKRKSSVDSGAAPPPPAKKAVQRVGEEDSIKLLY